MRIEVRIVEGSVEIRRRAVDGAVESQAAVGDIGDRADVVLINLELVIEVVNILLPQLAVDDRQLTESCSDLQAGSFDQKPTRKVFDDLDASIGLSVLEEQQCLDDDAVSHAT